MTDKQRQNLQGQIEDAVDQRQPWETRQTRWYELRHHGLRRQNKPWLKAADLHWPLIDTAIEALGFEVLDAAYVVLCLLAGIYTAHLVFGVLQKLKQRNGMVCVRNVRRCSAIIAA